MHIHNVSIILNSTLSSKFVNQVTFAASSFLQVFNDRNQSFNVQGNGLPLGLTGQLGLGAPSFRIGSFDYTGATAPLGRQDVTGHVTDQMHYTLGRHDLKFGGEYRHANLNVAYYVNGRGTFTFDGSRGGWSDADCAAGGLDPTNTSANRSFCSTGKQVADFLIGATQATTGSQILRNNPQRVLR
jgi:hypothetical protein